MAMTSKVTVKYQRQAGFPGFSHVMMSAEEEILLEEGYDASEVRRAAYLAMADEIAERIEPVAAGYRKTNPAPKKAATKPAGPGKDPERTSELLKAAAAEARAANATKPQPTEPVKVPSDREPLREMPKYTEEGRRIRGTGQKSFTVGEINVAWEALVTAKIVETSPDTGTAANKARQDIRAWLKLTPLDPGFSQDELAMVVEAYDKWRGQGLTTEEAMMEVGNDYIGKYGGVGDPGNDDQEDESSETEAEPGDQGSGSDPVDPESNGQHGSDSGEEQPEPGGGEAGEPGSEDPEGPAGDGEAEA